VKTFKGLGKPKAANPETNMNHEAELEWCVPYMEFLHRRILRNACVLLQGTPWVQVLPQKPIFFSE
jgi:hypothetical protein